MYVLILFSEIVHVNQLINRQLNSRASWSLVTGASMTPLPLFHGFFSYNLWRLDWFHMYFFGYYMNKRVPPNVGDDPSFGGWYLYESEIKDAVVSLKHQKLSYCSGLKYRIRRTLCMVSIVSY